jgi:hypothetical protein
VEIEIKGTEIMYNCCRGHLVVEKNCSL